MTRRSDPNPAYWEQYGPFQHVKHELIRCYLNGWFPKLGTWAGRVLYVDTHAGRGRYESGDPGSPLVALKTLLDHSYREKLLAASEFNFLFIERDPANLAALETELKQFSPLPARVNVDTGEGDAFERLSTILADLRRDRARMAPAFLFVDPYGFKIPAALLADLMKAGRVELFINVMWRELDMLIQQRPEPGTPHAQTLDEIFASDAWRTEITGSGMDERLERAIPLMARGIGAKWWTSAVRMVTGGQATRYVLLHLTNSDDGRDLMKECAWSVSPAGEFLVRRSDNPDQQFLIRPEPDLRPLRDWIIGRLSRRPERWQDLHAAVRPEWWLPKHVNDVVRGLRKEGVITADAVPGRKFGAAANPVLRLVRSKPGTQLSVPELRQPPLFVAAPLAASAVSFLTSYYRSFCARGWALLVGRFSVAQVRNRRGEKSTIQLSAERLRSSRTFPRARDLATLCDRADR